MRSGSSSEGLRRFQEASFLEGMVSHAVCPRWFGGDASLSDGIQDRNSLRSRRDASVVVDEFLNRL